MCQKDHFVDLDKLIWTCLAWLGGLFY
jgi:hypothetical protein